MAAVIRSLVISILACLPVCVSADDVQAKVDYLIHCQGCHLPEAVGVAGKVPRMKNFLGYYLHSEDGRRFIVQVPGAATANLDDARLADLMNWLLLRYSKAELPYDFEPYTAAEVGKLRPKLDPNPDETRTRILLDIAKDVPALAAEMESEKGY